MPAPVSPSTSTEQSLLETASSCSNSSRITTERPSTEPNLPRVEAGTSFSAEAGEMRIELLPSCSVTGSVMVTSETRTGPRKVPFDDE